jgi:hypothetical protein
MISETLYFETEEEAEAHGKAFVAAWGYGYGAGYLVWFAYNDYACRTRRYSSCD